MIAATISLLIISGIIYCMYRGKKNTEIETYFEKDKPIPVLMGTRTVYLRPDEQEAWDNLTRKEKRDFSKQFEKKIKSGEYYPVKQEDGTIIYADKKKQSWEKIA